MSDDGQVLLEIFRHEIRWYHFVTPEARNIVTDRVRTAAVKRLAAAGKVDIGTAEPGSYSVPSLISAEITHACPPAGTGLTPCCGRTPFELPTTHRMTLDANLVTCRREGPGSTSPEPGPDCTTPICSVSPNPHKRRPGCPGPDGEVAP